MSIFPIYTFPQFIYLPIHQSTINHPSIDRIDSILFSKPLLSLYNQSIGMDTLAPDHFDSNSPIGPLVTISGRNFTGEVNYTCSYAGFEVAATRVSSTQVTCQLPGGVSPGRRLLYLNFGEAESYTTNQLIFEYYGKITQSFNHSID